MYDPVDKLVEEVIKDFVVRKLDPHADPKRVSLKTDIVKELLVFPVELIELAEHLRDEFDISKSIEKEILEAKTVGDIVDIVMRAKGRIK